MDHNADVNARNDENKTACDVVHRLCEIHQNFDIQSLYDKGSLNFLHFLIYVKGLKKLELF